MDSLEEKIFLEKLAALGIRDPKITKNPCGILLASPPPESNQKWRASYNHAKDQRFDFIVEPKKK